MATEADCFVETFAALEFEGNALDAAVLFDDLGGDPCSFENGTSDLGVGTVIDKENVAKLDFIVSLDGKFVDTDGVSFLDAVLFSAGFEDCVCHDGKRKRFKPPKRMVGAEIQHVGAV